MNGQSHIIGLYYKVLERLGISKISPCKNAKNRMTTHHENDGHLTFNQGVVRSNCTRVTTANRSVERAFLHPKITHLIGDTHMMHTMKFKSHFARFYGCRKPHFSMGFFPNFHFLNPTWTLPCILGKMAKIPQKTCEKAIHGFENSKNQSKTE